jgi:hypothetical protein
MAAVGLNVVRETLRGQALGRPGGVPLPITR